VNDPLILVRAVHFAATLTLAGALIFATAIAGPVLRRVDDKAACDRAACTLRVQLLWIAWLGLALALLSALVWLTLVAAQTGEAVWTVLLHTTLGHAWLVRLVPAALLGAALCWISPVQAGAARWMIAALLAAAFTLALVHSGHAAATPGWFGTLHRTVDGLHLLAASAWLGGLLPLAPLLGAARRGAVPLATVRDVTLRFSALGVISVGTLVATGIANGWILAGGAPGLVGTEYGRLLLVKVALFLAMVAVAAINRRHLTPRLARVSASTQANGDALRPLIRNCLVEATIGLAILFVIGALGTMPPGAVVQPSWPFALRLSDAALGDPPLRATLVPALWTIAGGTVLAVAAILVGLCVRRSRWWLIAAAGAIAVALALFVLPALRVLTVEAYPTTYYRSPTAYSAGSILRGADLFTTYCAACHGRQGRGDGPAGRFFRVKPADLTADHVYGHTDGDLYWWITYGIGEVMPPQGAALDEGARWNVIDFVRANADAARLGAAPAKVTDVGYRAPNFAAICPDGSTVTRDNLGGRVAHLVVGGGRGAATRLARVATRDRDGVVIAIQAEEEIAAGAACRTDDAELAKVLAMFRGKAAGQDEGAEFLIDPAGALRAGWAPGGKPDWSDADVLAREIAAVRDHPAAARPTGSHLHAQ
jgi:putative copper resistance protein D